MSAVCVPPRTPCSQHPCLGNVDNIMCEFGHLRTLPACTGFAFSCHGLTDYAYIPLPGVGGVRLADEASGRQDHWSRVLTDRLIDR